MNLRFIIPAMTITVLIACAGKKGSGEHEHAMSESKPEVQLDTIKKSIPKEEHVQLHGAHAMIKYHAPAVRGRVIWGGLVPMGEVWVTGAHSATSFEIDKSFVVNGTEIAAGKYALFTIPNTDKWTIIINKNWDQHLADDYDQKLDLVRLDVTPEQLQDVQERLKYAIVSLDNSNATIDITWEKVKVSLPFKIK
jgi:hypothetical protein